MNFKNKLASILFCVTLSLLSVSLTSCTQEPESRGVVRAAYVPAGYYLPFLIVDHEGLL